VTIVLDWLDLGLRWFHVIAGIAWIGASFFFIWLDASLRPAEHLPQGVRGETWMVHGGGFYHAQKYTVAPAHLPEHLHWFKYEAYFTWISGFLLLAVIYYANASLFLIDPGVAAMPPWAAIAISAGSLTAGWLVYDGLCRSPIGRHTGILTGVVFVFVVAVAWGYFQVFAGRAAALHVGALLGTIMAANVFFVIIPNQKKTVAAMLDGHAPEPALGLQAKQRSTHNNYITLPVVLMMIGGHYPVLADRDRGWLLVALALVLGALLRDFFNRTHAGESGPRLLWRLPVAATAFAAMILVATYDLAPPPSAAAMTAGAPVTTNEVEAIVRQRCARCHAVKPIDEAFDQPPAGLVLDGAAAIRRNARKILARAVDGRSIPLANKTAMTEQERARLGAWIRAQEAQ